MLLDVVLPGVREHFDLVLLFGILATVTLIVGEQCQRAIALRARPVLAPDLVAADEAIRSVAARSVGYGASGSSAFSRGRNA